MAPFTSATSITACASRNLSHPRAHFPAISPLNSVGAPRYVCHHHRSKRSLSSFGFDEVESEGSPLLHASFFSASDHSLSQLQSLTSGALRVFPFRPFKPHTSLELQSRVLFHHHHRWTG